MKQSFRNFTLGLLIIINGACHAQQMVKSVSDSKLLEINKEKFIGKPLKYLLKEIKPKIEVAIGNPTNTNPEVNTSITFYFDSKKTYLERSKKNEKTVYIVVIFKPDYRNPPKRELGKPSNWNKEDIEAYGNMIIGYVRVGGTN